MIIMALHAAVVERDDDLLRSFWGDYVLLKF